MCSYFLPVYVIGSNKEYFEFEFEFQMQERMPWWRHVIKIQDSRIFYCLKYKHHKQHDNNSTMYIRQREVETYEAYLPPVGKNSCSCTHVDQWQQKG